MTIQFKGVGVEGHGTKTESPDVLEELIYIIADRWFSSCDI
jgi:hypothetical protein